MAPSYDPDGVVRPGNIPKKKHPMLGNVEKKLTIIHIGNPFGHDLEHDTQAVPGRPAKISKDEAGYGDGERCGNCSMFRRDPDGMGMGTCTKVAGVIDPKKWCELWAPEQSDEAAEPDNLDDEEGE